MGICGDWIEAIFLVVLYFYVSECYKSDLLSRYINALWPY